MRTPFLLFCILFCTASVSAQISKWEPMNRGLQHTLVYSIVVDPVDSLLMYCGTDYGRLYKSTDGGFNWILHNNGIPEEYTKERVTALEMNPENRAILYAGFSGRESKKNLFQSTNSGASWNIIDTPDDWTAGGILHIHHTAGLEKRLYVGLGWWHGLYYTSDNGSSWTPSQTSAGIQCIAGHPDRPELLLAGCSDGQVLLRSTDGGATWQPAVQGIDPISKNTGVRSLAFSRVNPDIVFAGVTRGATGLHRSTDGGASWIRLNDIGEISEIAIHPDNENVMYISAINTGVHRSLDGGDTWQLISKDLPSNAVMRVRVAPGYPVRVFAVTLEHGIYRMVDEELPEHLFPR